MKFVCIHDFFFFFLKEFFITIQYVGKWAAWRRSAYSDGVSASRQRHRSPCPPLPRRVSYEPEPRFLPVNMKVFLPVGQDLGFLKALRDSVDCNQFINKAKLNLLCIPLKYRVNYKCLLDSNVYRNVCGVENSTVKLVAN